MQIIIKGALEAKDRWIAPGRQGAGEREAGMVEVMTMRRDMNIIVMLIDEFVLVLFSYSNQLVI
jgi:hypothetical protein